MRNAAVRATVYSSLASVEAENRRGSLAADIFVLTSAVGQQVRSRLLENQIERVRPSESDFRFGD